MVYGIRLLLEFLQEGDQMDVVVHVRHEGRRRRRALAVVRGGVRVDARLTRRGRRRLEQRGRVAVTRRQLERRAVALERRGQSADGGLDEQVEGQSDGERERGHGWNASTVIE